MKTIILYLSIIIASGILMTNVYTSIVDARSWGSNLPESIEVTRKYFSAVNPGTFFRMFSPLNQIIALVAVILFWKAGSSVRLFLCLAFGFYLATDMFTFAYFYPRNEIMFGTSTDMDAVRKAWTQWSAMNWLRSLVILTGVIFSFVALHKLKTSQG
jgi:Domain of unknown function (DUF1772)